ncbi:hypothetical protein [Niveibacterium sp. SC-1]|uniref:hypothetical protein n=1 Tax=Niveibacterium sp. SC-1 TaxID=3135646 RepID=UPI00311DC2D5
MCLSAKTCAHALVIALSLCSAGETQAYRYTFTDLGTLGGYISSEARSINNRGQIVGESRNSTWNSRATLWDGGAIIDLGTGAGPYTDSTAMSINASGQISGSAFWRQFPPPTQSGSTGLLWHEGQVATLPPLPGGDLSYAGGINDAGQVVGISTNAAFDARPVVWNAGQPTDLGGEGAGARAINESGLIVGYASLPAGGTHAALWQDGVLTGLGGLGGNLAGAEDINDAGQIVGLSTVSDTGPYHATLWDHGLIIDLGTSAGQNSSAVAINARGQIVGYYIDIVQGGGPVLWENNAPLLLEALVDPATITPGWSIGNPADINDLGWIVGAAYNAQTQESRAYLLRPVEANVSEPSSAALLVAASGALCLAARRRRPNGRRGVPPDAGTARVIL